MQPESLFYAHLFCALQDRICEMTIDREYDVAVASLRLVIAIIK